MHIGPETPTSQHEEPWSVDNKGSLTFGKVVYKIEAPKTRFNPFSYFTKTDPVSLDERIDIAKKLNKQQIEPEQEIEVKVGGKVFRIVTERTQDEVQDFYYETKVDQFIDSLVQQGYSGDTAELKMAIIKDKAVVLSGSTIRAIPTEIGNLHKVEVIDLHDTEITTLPASIKNLSNLKRITLTRTLLFEKGDEANLGQKEIRAYFGNRAVMPRELEQGRVSVEAFFSKLEDPRCSSTKSEQFEKLTGRSAPKKQNASDLDRWLLKSLEYATGFPRKKRAEVSAHFSKVEEQVGFANTLALFANCYQLAYSNKDKGDEWDRDESAFAIDFFKNRLEELILENAALAEELIGQKEVQFREHLVPTTSVEAIGLAARIRRIEKEELEARYKRYKMIGAVALIALVALPAAYLLTRSREVSQSNSTDLGERPRTTKIPAVPANQIFATVNNQNQPRKISLVTAYDEGIKEYADLVIPNQRTYAAEHKYNYIEYRGNLAHDEGIPRAPYWSKIVALNDMLQKIPEGEWLVWLDASALFTNSNKNFDEIIDTIAGMYGEGKDLIVTTDPHVPINNAVFIVRNTPWTKKWIQKVWSRTDLAKGGEGNCWSWGLPICHYEQQAMTELWQASDDVQAHSAVIPNKIMNAFYRYSHYDKYRDMDLDYDSDAENTKWQPGDFICKVTGMDKDRRLMIINHVATNCINKACERLMFHP